MAPVADIRALVQLALAEDLAPLGDLTSSLLDPALMATAELNARQPGVIAGAMCVEETFSAVDPTLEISWVKTDGDKVAQGDTIAVATGPYATLLTAERTALNFMSALSGIATNVARWVEVAAGRLTVWDTRKTTPGYRSLQKAAVRAGGAANHRGNLSDWLMLKDNHLVGMSITEAVALAKLRWPGRTVHVEADREDQMLEALAAGASIILLDNFTPPELSDLVGKADAWAAANNTPRALLEASGGITFETLDAYSGTGVDLLSSSALTVSAGILDIGLDVVPNS